MKKYAVPLIIGSIGISLIGYGVLTCLPPKKEPVKVDYFKPGQILYPDMACPDTLIVRDAAGLNLAMGYIEQGISGQDFGDYQYDSLFKVYCDYYEGSFEHQFRNMKAYHPTWDSLKIETAINED